MARKLAASSTEAPPRTRMTSSELLIYMLLHFVVAKIKTRVVASDTNSISVVTPLATLPSITHLAVNVTLRFRPETTVSAGPWREGGLDGPLALPHPCALSGEMTGPELAGAGWG